MKKYAIALSSMLVGLSGACQTFDESAPSKAAELKALIVGKVFTVALADGGSWRLDFRANGYYFVNTNTGFSDTGTWRTEDGKLCTEPNRGTAACHDTRLVKGELQLKRMSGEILTLKPKQ